jgi:hypothetical protein
MTTLREKKLNLGGKESFFGAFCIWFCIVISKRRGNQKKFKNSNSNNIDSKIT